MGPTPQLDPSELAAFVAAVECGTVSAAADDLALTQSAASKRIASLERRLGATLLERGRCGVCATPAGQLLYPEAKQILAALAHAAAVINDHAALAPTMRLAASHTIGGYLLPAWIAAFRARDATGIRANVEIINSEGVLASVRDGHVDIGFIESRHGLDGLDAMMLLEDEIVAVVAPDHPWARRRTIPAQALSTQPYLARERGSGTRAVAVAALQAVGLSEPRPVLETASTQSLKRGVVDGGYALISRLAVDSEVTAGTLVALQVSGVNMTRSLRALRRRRPAAKGPARQFWEFLRPADPLHIGGTRMSR